MARVELLLMAAQDVKNVTTGLLPGSSGKMRSYVVCWVDPSRKQVSRIVSKAGKDPVWNEAMSVTVDESALANPYACLTLQIMSSRRGGDEYDRKRDRVVGTAWVPLHEIARLSATSSINNVVTLDVHRPSGRVQGVIRLRVCLIGVDTLKTNHKNPPSSTSVLTGFSSTPSTPSTASLYDEPDVSSPSASNGRLVEGIPVMSYDHHAYFHQHYSPPLPSAPPVPSPPPPLPAPPRPRNGILLGLLGGALAAMLVGDIFLH